MIATSTKQEIRENKKINSDVLRSLTAEITVNPAVGEGLAAKVVKCIDTSQINTKILKEFISSLTDQQTLLGEFCSALHNTKPFVVELFNKFQESDEELLLSLISAVPHLSDAELNRLLERAIMREKTTVEELLKRNFSIDSTLFHFACEYGIRMGTVISKILNKAPELLKVRNEEGVSRTEIRGRIQREEGIFFVQGDQDPIEAIQLHRQRDYNNHAPTVEEWRKDFYNPIFEEIELLRETANFTDYLHSKGITSYSVNSKADAKAAVIQHRRDDHFQNKIEEKDWKKEMYESLIKTVESMQSRDDIRKTLLQNGITLDLDRDFANLLEQVREIDYLSNVFKYDDEEINIIGIDPTVVKKMLLQMDVINYFS